jgi:pimeloyl-ACP methyl ester carboxylesterase
MEPQVRYVRTEDGVNIAYYTMGSGPPFVWSMAPTSHLLAERRVPEMKQALDGTARFFRLVRYDPRGFGLSDRRVTDFSPEYLSRDLQAVIDKEGLDGIILLGAAIGSYAAMKYATLHPEKVSYLILMSTARQGNSARATLLQTLADLAQIDWGLASETIIRSFYGSSNEMAALLRESVHPEQIKAVGEQVALVDMTELLSALTVPTLLIHDKGI